MTTMDYDYDITVIGGGPGGYVAAIAAAKKGQRVCLVERGNLGGVCLNEGCIPTKTLIHTANLLGNIKESGAFAIEGVEPKNISVSMSKLQKRKQDVVKQLVGGVGGLLRGNHVTVIRGSAAFQTDHSIEVGGQTVSSEYFIIATGSETLIPKFILQEGKNNLLTSRELLSLDKIPASMAIIGGGVIGIEFAYLLSKLGCKVTVLELMDQILPMADEEIAKLAQARLANGGVTFHLGAKVEKIKDNAVYFTQDEKQSIVQAESVLLAVGRKPNTEGLCAEKIGVELDRNAIKTDERLRTNLKHIYAIGDVNGKCMLAHTASHEGITAVSNITGGLSKVDYNKNPSCIYLQPEIACIGLTEEQAKKQYGNIRVGKFPMAANGKSLIEGDTTGMIKLIADAEFGEILGVHLYCYHATDMIAEIALAMMLEATAEEIIETIHPHPTFSEAVPEAFMSAYDGAIHSLR